MLDITPFKSEKAGARATLPKYPTNWKPVKDFPNLNDAKIIAIDTETKDPELLIAGPGWGRGVGHMIGVSVAVPDASWYFPMRHEVQSELNMNPDQVLAWCRDTFGTNIPKVFANASYDLGWLKEENVQVRGKPYDIIIAEKLLDSSKFSYSLENISQTYLGEGKVSNKLYKWCSRAYGGKPDGKQRANMYRTPPSLAGPYAESDARLPFDIFRKQWKLLELANLLEVFDIETRLIPVLIDMRMRGVPISEEKAHVARQGLHSTIERVQSELNQLAGFRVNANSSADLEKLFIAAKVKIEYTAKGNPSFQKEWLEHEPHPAADKIRKIRQYTKTISTFIDGAILGKQINGRVFGQLNQMGAGTGRFSSSNPNLQNIPSRDPYLGPLMRGMFIPEECHDWIKMDYSSVEFRVFAHFIKDPILLNAYNNNPNTDFHKVVQEMVGGGLPRVAYKTISFSQMFGGGVETITKQMHLNFTPAEQRQIIKQFGHKVLSNPAEQLARLIMNLYNKQFPTVKDALEQAGDIAKRTGEMRTLLNRRVTYDRYEPIRGKGFPVTYGQAVSNWGRSNIRRAKTYKALNVYTQGGSADIIKKAMVLAYEEGLFRSDKLGAPHLTVHDELDFSYHDDLRVYFLRVKKIMEHAIELDVPLVVDGDVGPDWGSVKSFDLTNGVYK